MTTKGVRVLALLLLLPACAAALELPAGGLPQGRLASGPFLAASPVSARRFAAFQVQLRSLGASAGSEWLSIDPEEGRAAAGPLIARLPERFSLGQFWAAQGAARAQASQSARAAVARFEAEAARGRAGAEDLNELALALRPFSVYGGEPAKIYEEVRGAARAQRQARVDQALERTRAALEQRRTRRLAKAARFGSGVILSAAFAASLHPSLAPHGAAGVLTWAGLSAATAAKFLGPVRAPGGSAAPAGALRLPARLRKQLATILSLGKAAEKAAAAQTGLEAAAGRGSAPAFKAWLLGGLKAGALWAPLALLGMLGGSLLSVPFKLLLGAPAAQALPAAALVKTSFLSMLNGYVAAQLLSETVTLAGLFAALRGRLARLSGWAGAHAELLAGAATLAALAPIMALSGFPWPVIFPALGIQAVLVLLYVKSRSLLAALTAQGLLALTAVESTRMLAFLKIAAPGTLAGLPAWTALAAGGLCAAAFGAWSLRTQAGSLWRRLRDGARAQLSRVRSGRNVVSLGLLWALPAYLSMEAAFRAVHAVIPQAEPTPEILRRVLLMPADVILFNFVIVAALEEWVFRRGVYRWLSAKLEKTALSRRVRFWAAAVLSGLVFSAAHYVNWNALMGGGANADLIRSLGAGAYAFTWASFAARAVGGVLLAWLYENSGLLLLPMIAHFGSNTLEAIGQRFGLPGFLLAAGAVLALQWRRKGVGR